MNRMQRKKLSLAIVNALNAGVVVGLAVPMAYAQQSPCRGGEVAVLQPEKLEKIESWLAHSVAGATSDSPVSVIARRTSSSQAGEHVGHLNHAAAPDRAAPVQRFERTPRSTCGDSARSARSS